jgi:hypothetical protein
MLSPAEPRNRLLSRIADRLTEPETIGHRIGLRLAAGYRRRIEIATRVTD